MRPSRPRLIDACFALPRGLMTTILVGATASAPAGGGALPHDADPHRDVRAREAARAMFDADAPTPARVERAGRRLARLPASGLVAVAVEGDKATSRSTRWGTP